MNQSPGAAGFVAFVGAFALGMDFPCDLATSLMDFSLPTFEPELRLCPNKVAFSKHLRCEAAAARLAAAATDAAAVLRLDDIIAMLSRLPWPWLEPRTMSVLLFSFSFIGHNSGSDRILPLSLVRRSDLSLGWLCTSLVIFVFWKRKKGQ